jgi:hypothetical protein
MLLSTREHPSRSRLNKVDRVRSRDDINAYRRELYRKSLKYRLSRINATRRRREVEEVSINQASLRSLAEPAKDQHP